MAYERDDLLVTGRESGERFLRRVDRLAPLDFYVPLRADRVAWTGGTAPWVAAHRDADGPFRIAFGENGESIRLEVERHSPDRPLVFIHGADPRFRRVGGGGISSETFIQSEEELDFGGNIEYVTDDGDVRVVDFSELGPALSECGENLGMPPGDGTPRLRSECDEEGGGGTPAYYFKLVGVYTYFTDYFNSAEVEHDFKGPGGSVTIRNTGLDSYRWYSQNDIIWLAGSGALGSDSATCSEIRM